LTTSSWLTTGGGDGQYMWMSLLYSLDIVKRMYRQLNFVKNNFQYWNDETITTASITR